MEQHSLTRLKKFIEGYSIEVTPRSAANIESFKDVLPRNTRVYIAHIEHEDIKAMVNTAKKINEEPVTDTQFLQNKYQMASA